MHIDFEISDNSTLGVEWEVALVDRDSGELAQRAQEVLEAVVSEYPELGEEGDHPQVCLLYTSRCVSETGKRPR